jgi:tRNA-uridine 2-sulfurtransferase
VCLGGGIIEHAITGQPAELPQVEPQSQSRSQSKKRRQKAALLGAR